MTSYLTVPKRVLHGEILAPGDWRAAGDRYGVGDYVTRDGTDVHKVIELDGPGSNLGTFLCVLEPYSEPGEEPWITVGETESNLTSRYSPANYRSV